ncbi:MAG: VanZ family protein [Gammaproteobacteria bacterium]|nr:VanZ family protein [Gammaproteobacteria bacterium]
MPTERHHSRRRILARHRGLLLWLGLLYLVFVVYGSLVPLDYHALPWDEATARFQAIPFLSLGIGSRADWMANLLLFIPLAFLWNGALAHGRHAALGAAATLFVWLAAAALSLGIEFTQLFFPQRTVSQNDIAAEVLGALIGTACWWGFGARLLAWYEGWHREREPAALAERAAWAYLILLVGYNVLPLDLTISVVEVYHKWQAGKLNLLPFASLPGDPVHALFELATDALLWVPLAWLWHARPGRDSVKVWRMAFLAALGLEFMQLFVYSRVSDVTDLFTGALGAGIGAWLGKRQFGARRSAATSRATPSPSWQRLALALAWVPVLMGVFWYPFDFRGDGDFVRERMVFLERVPFQVYYFGTEFRAITEVFHKTLFFAPLGVLLAWWVSGLSWRWRGYAAAASLLSIIAIALGIELGQVLLPGKFPDTTDWFLESVGGMLGYVMFRIIHNRLLPRPKRSGGLASAAVGYPKNERVREKARAHGKH